MNNPIKLIDPDGRAPGGPGDPSKRINAFANKIITPKNIRIALGVKTTLDGAALFTAGVVAGSTPTGVGQVVGAAACFTGGYQVVNGITQIANAASNGDAKFDPQYKTPLGEMSGSTTVDNVADLATGLMTGRARTGVKGIDLLNNANTIGSASSVAKSVTDEIESASNSSSSQKSETIDRKQTIITTGNSSSSSQKPATTNKEQ